MKPPFSYYGGKQKIVKKIIPYIPPHNVFAEPFAGSATLLFAKPDYLNAHYSYAEVINDINSDIHNFFCVLRDDYDKLKKYVDYSLYSQEEYKIAKEYDGEDKILKAYYFFVNISQSFAQKINGGWGTSVFLNNHSTIYYNKKQALEACHKRLEKVCVANEDALRFIKRWDSPQTFFYCDPPYPKTNQGHYSGYSQNDFKNLIDVLSQIKGSFILSCYNNEAVPLEWEKVEFQTFASASNTKCGGHRDKRTECIWIKQASKQPREEILKIYERQKQLAFSF